MGCKSIIVIEDDPDIRETLFEALSIEGYHVATASNGKEGLAILAEAPTPCLVLLDLMMPVMNGWEFLKAKRQDDILAVIPVLVVTAYSEQAHTGNDVCGVIKKPMELESLLDVVRKYCG